MSPNVEEADLDVRCFHCCGDEDLYPFGCPRCGRLMVFCYECDTLHGDLHDLSQSGREAVNNFDTSSPLLCCPECAFPFEYFFVRDGKYKSSLDQWQRQGVSHLLRPDRQPTASMRLQGLAVERDSTLLVASYMICTLSWMTESLILVCHLLFGKLPGDNLFAHVVLIVLMLSSSAYIRIVGRHRFRSMLRMDRPPNVTAAQSVLVTAILLTYTIILMWALGLFLC